MERMRAGEQYCERSCGGSAFGFLRKSSGVSGGAATQSAHYRARILTAFGHEVKLIAPQFVKPYLKRQKNDAQDAAAICEAVGGPEMRFVPPKSIGQQETCRHCIASVAG
jgi:transposase